MEYNIPIFHLLIVTSLCLSLGLLSMKDQLGLEKSILLSTLRALIQLLIFGFILRTIVDFKSPWQVVLVGISMSLLAIYTVRARLPNKRYTSFKSLITSIFLCSWIFSITLVFFLNGEINFSPMKFIPLLGMILGNSLNGITLGLQRVQIEMEEKKDQIISLLGFGKSVNESTLDIKRSAMLSALTPVLNSMLVVGLVSFPGLMTGKILSGTDPFEAGKAQFLVLAFIFITLFCGCWIGISIQIKKYFPGSLYFLPEISEEK